MHAPRIYTKFPGIDLARGGERTDDNAMGPSGRTRRWLCSVSQKPRAQSRAASSRTCLRMNRPFGVCSDMCVKSYEFYEFEPLSNSPYWILLMSEHTPNCRFIRKCASMRRASESRRRKPQKGSAAALDFARKCPVPAKALTATMSPSTTSRHTT